MFNNDDKSNEGDGINQTTLEDEQEDDEDEEEMNQIR